MGGQRSDQSSEAIEQVPQPLRWTQSVLTVVRVIVALQAVGGVIGIAVGLATLDGRMVILGIGQLVLAGIVFGLNVGSEHITEITGPGGAFVIRTARRRTWSGERGWNRIQSLLSGERTWTVQARRRAGDPFGPTVITESTETEQSALRRSAQIAEQLRKADQPAAGSPDRRDPQPSGTPTTD